MTPERLGPFLLFERLAGLPGEAYRARRVVTGGQLSAPILIERFRAPPRSLAAELARAAAWGAQAAHPGIVRLLEVGKVDGTLYAASELVEGVDLGTVLAAAAAAGRAPSVSAAVAIGAQLARVARALHDEGSEPLGLFRPADVLLGYDGRVRVRAKGAVELPRPGEGRDPFLAPELARGAPLAPVADVWTVTRVLRAVLAQDPLGKKTPKVSALYKDSLGSILTEALAREPAGRLSIRALEQRLLDVAREDADDLHAPVLELLAEHAGGRLPIDDDTLGFSAGEALAEEAGPAAEVIFPLASGTVSRARPRVELPSDEGDDVSLEAVAAAGDVRLVSAAALPGDDVDLDAIARSSLEDQAPLEDPPGLAGTAVVARPPTLPPSQHDDGDVFQPTSPATKVARLPSPERSSREAVKRSREPAAPTAEVPAVRPDESHAEVFASSGPVPAAPGDVFTATGRASDLLGGSSAPSSRTVRSRAKGRAAIVPSEDGPRETLDPDKTAYLDDPAALFRSGVDKPAVRPLTPLPPADDDDLPTERLSAELVQAAVRRARGAPADEPEQPDESLEAAPAEPSVLEDELGRLVIDVPDGAAVFVNGEQRGRGRTTLEGLDRFANLIVRVHHRGHQPWTGTVTLKGMAAARIQPELIRRR